MSRPAASAPGSRRAEPNGPGVGGCVRGCSHRGWRRAPRQVD
ncbi:hypothetical protein TVNIR_1413 [Thioalkalivibrio nitratireducens DSM 14787]|uniref:Uncharacterized protein n=1 Tax=Thioalkalivibrio nitratireducens (strain DSM 14787 / UNIQEM 213 / ALEN2) TaxID=1255043 RepID=L0DVM3_THIND|nr:hypothetical protein TVNIR_1413 [Thioalkalivibrio nitratireducens DSM 14787]